MNQNNQMGNPPIIQGVVIQLVPNHVILTINKPGFGKIPLPGQFISLRQQTFSSNMISVSQGRRVFIRGRNRLIDGLQIGLSVVKQSMKGRFQISAQYAYGSQSIGELPPHSDIIIDFEILSISDNSSSSYIQQQEIYHQLLFLAKNGDQQAQKGNWYQCMRFYDKAMKILLVDRFYTKKNQKIKQRILIIHLKAIQVAIIIKDYYQAIIWCQKYAEVSGNVKIHRCQIAKVRALNGIGQFEFALNELNQMLTMDPSDQITKKLLQNVKQRQKYYNQLGYQQKQQILPLKREYLKYIQKKQIEQQKIISKIKQITKQLDNSFKIQKNINKRESNTQVKRKIEQQSQQQENQSEQIKRQSSLSQNSSSFKVLASSNREIQIQNQKELLKSQSKLLKSQSKVETINKQHQQVKVQENLQEKLIKYSSMQEQLKLHNSNKEFKFDDQDDIDFTKKSDGQRSKHNSIQEQEQEDFDFKFKPYQNNEKEQDQQENSDQSIQRI